MEILKENYLVAQKFFQETLLTDITESNFQQAVFWMVFNLVCWIVIPQLEYRYNIISRFTNKDKGIANDFFAFSLIQTGALRSLYFENAIKESIKIEYGPYAILVEILSAIMIVSGFIIIMMTFARMGIRGMYFGDYFGFLFKEKITAFPFSHLNDPQYFGTTTLFTGYSLFYHSPAGLVLTVLTYLLY